MEQQHIRTHAQTNNEDVICFLFVTAHLGMHTHSKTNTRKCLNKSLQNTIHFVLRELQMQTQIHKFTVSFSLKEITNTKEKLLALNLLYLHLYLTQQGIFSSKHVPGGSLFPLAFKQSKQQPVNGENIDCFPQWQHFDVFHCNKTLYINQCNLVLHKQWTIYVLC